MSTRELLLQEISTLDESQLQEVLVFIQDCYGRVKNQEMLAAVQDVRERRNIVGPFETVAALMEDLNAEA